MIKHFYKFILLISNTCTKTNIAQMSVQHDTYTFSYSKLSRILTFGFSPLAVVNLRLFPPKCPTFQFLHYNGWKADYFRWLASCKALKGIKTRSSSAHKVFLNLSILSTTLFNFYMIMMNLFFSLWTLHYENSMGEFLIQIFCVFVDNQELSSRKFSFFICFWPISFCLFSPCWVNKGAQH